MKTPISDTPNNWGPNLAFRRKKYIGQIGKETFDVRISVDTQDGKILTAHMDKIVQFLSSVESAKTQHWKSAVRQNQKKYIVK